MEKQNNKLTYSEFVAYMKRYKNETKAKSLKEKSSSTYSYKRVFNKRNKNK